MSTTPRLEELDPESPEYEAAVQAAQEAEDREIGNEEGAAPQGETSDEETDPPAGATAAAAAPAPAQEPPRQEDTPPAAGGPKVAGVASKDGKKVLPYAALQGARRETQQERAARIAAEQRAAALEQELADLKAGKKPVNEDEHLDEVLTDYPSMKPVVDEVRELRKKLAAAPAPAPRSEPGEEADPQTTVQEAIDTVPLLAEWQHADREKFQRAVQFDKVLQSSPKWQGKPLEARFKEAARLTAQEFDLQFEDDDDTTPTPNPPSGSRKKPDEVIEGAGRNRPNTLSDFKGGAPDKTDSLERLPAPRQLARFDEMTDEEIEAHLRRTGGG